MLSSDTVVEGAECEELEKVVIDDDKENFFQVRIQLPSREKEQLVVFLRENIDVLAWDAYEALGVDPSFIFHHLNVNPFVIPKKQPLGTHLRNTLMLSRKSYSSLNRLRP